MDRLLLKHGLFSLLFIAAVQFSFAQKTYQLQNTPDLKVSGTSSLHDWVMPSNEASGTMKAEAESEKLMKITAIDVKMPAESIKSGKKAMDKKAYKAMKTNKHKFVEFSLDNATKSSDTWTLKGTFSIAGKAKKVNIKAKEVSNSGAFTLKGSYAFKLTDYDIDPPTALMGSIKTGDEVEVSFDVSFK